MKFLLIGSRGFIGQEILLQLIHQGFDVIELNRSDSDPLGYMNTKALSDIFASHSINGVISAAWTTSQSTYRDSSENFEHQKATENLALEARKNAVPIFVSLGSAAEYGHLNLAATSLSSSLKPVDNYSSAKIATFRALTGIFDSTETLFIWPRIFQPYGQGQDRNRFLPSLISSLRSNTKLEINNPGHVYDWINVVDVAKAIIFSIANRIGGAIDIGTGEGTSNIELANIVSRAIRGIDFASSSSTDSVIRGLVMSSNTQLSNYGWKPEFTLHSSIESLVR